MSRKLVPIHEAAEALGVSAQTLRRWEREGRLLPDERTAGGRRRYDLARLKPEKFRSQAEAVRKTVAYARVSSHDQKAASIVGFGVNTPAEVRLPNSTSPGPAGT